MHRWYLMALCLALLDLSISGCIARQSPRENTSRTLATPAPAFLTAVDVDVLQDHTLITLQSDAALRYAVGREDEPPRLIIDLPDHAIAPGVRALEIFRGGVSRIQPLQGSGGTGSRVEIGLIPPVTHHLSLPFDGTLLVEVRPRAAIRKSAADDEATASMTQLTTVPEGQRPLAAGDLDNRLTLGRVIPGSAERASQVIGIDIEPLGDLTRVRVIGDGPILTYKTARPHPAQFVLALPSLTTDLAGRAVSVSTPHLTRLTMRPPDPQGTAIELALAAGVSPQVTREGAQVVVDLSRPTVTTGDPTPARLPAMRPVSADNMVGEPASGPRLIAQASVGSQAPSQDMPVYTGQRISLDFQQADLIDVLRLIAEVSGMNIITSPDVSGRVTTRMVNVPWDQALDMILKTHGLGKEQEGTIIRVAPLERLRRERDEVLQAKRVVEELEAPVTRTIQLSYARAEDLKANMEKLLTKQGRLDIDKRTNTIIVKDVSATVDEVVNLIRQLDSQTKQVAIDTRIVETNRTFLQELGVRWGGLFDKDTGVKFPRQVQLSGRQGPTPVGGNFAVDLPTTTAPALAFGFSLISNSSVIDLELEALERTGRGRIISNPKVVTLDNREAIVESGDEVPFRTESAQTGPKVEFKDAKITLKVTPHVTPDDFVLLEIDAAKKEVDFSRLVEGNPTITSRQSKTSILVKDGATAVIGGLFKRSSADVREGVPGLSNVPYLGWLFKTEQSRENNDDLLFFITPRIVRDNQRAQNQ
jgi:type IV pilus secretin PilQ/predicted competence protein